MKLAVRLSVLLVLLQYFVEDNVSLKNTFSVIPGQLKLHICHINRCSYFPKMQLVVTACILNILLHTL